jgi:hypothetical protein
MTDHQDRPTWWRKSSYSGSNGSCVEVSDPAWRKSTFSGSSGSCFELAERADDDLIAVRNSNRPEAGILEFTRAEMAAWIAGCKAGEFDDLI